MCRDSLTGPIALTFKKCLCGFVKMTDYGWPDEFRRIDVGKKIFNNTPCFLVY